MTYIQELWEAGLNEEEIAAMVEHERQQRREHRARQREQKRIDALTAQPAGTVFRYHDDGPLMVIVVRRNYSDRTHPQAPDRWTWGVDWDTPSHHVDYVNYRHREIHDTYREHDDGYDEAYVATAAFLSPLADKYAFGRKGERAKALRMADAIGKLSHLPEAIRIGLASCPENALGDHQDLEQLRAVIGVHGVSTAVLDAMEDCTRAFVYSRSLVLYALGKRKDRAETIDVARGDE